MLAKNWSKKGSALNGIQADMVATLEITFSFLKSETGEQLNLERRESHERRPPTGATEENVGRVH